MCAHYTYNRDAAKFRMREKIVAFGAVPRANIRPTDLGPVILPEYDGFACREMRWGWGVPWDKSPLIFANCEMLPMLAIFRPRLDNRNHSLSAVRRITSTAPNHLGSLGAGSPSGTNSSTAIQI